MTHKVAIIGDLVIDHFGFLDAAFKKGENYLIEELEISPGGVAGNISFYLKQFGFEPLVFSAVGDDEWARKLLSDLKERGISDRYVKRFEGKTGFLIILVEPDGERTMVGSRGVAESLFISSKEITDPSPSWIHLSGYALLGRHSKRILREAEKASKLLGIPLSIGLEGLHSASLDLSEDPFLFLCNMMEYRNFFGKGFDEIARSRRGMIIVKAGSKGCYILHRNVTKVEGRKVKNVRDTTGAGDLFDAAVIASILKNRDVRKACEIANLLASKKVESKGSRILFSQNFVKKYF